MVVLLVMAVVSGCASQSPKKTLREGARMVDLYRGTADPESAGLDGAEQRDATASAARTRCRWWLFTVPCEMTAPPVPAEQREAPYTRTAANELAFLFPRLPNPDIYIYVLPHLATDAAVPVPGYTTAVPLYERVQYALPGEVDDGTGGARGAAEPDGAEDGP